MKISEFAKRTGLSIDTLRYYEKLGLLEPKRDAGGRRVYSETDAAWMEFVGRLKRIGMPLSEIQAYARLRRAGDSTLEERMHMLEVQKVRLQNNICELREQLAALDDKIGFDRNAMDEAGQT